MPPKRRASDHQAFPDLVPTVLPKPVSCKDPKVFLDQLSPIGERFRYRSTRESWFFRGQCCDYPLIPSLFRHGEHLKPFVSRKTDSPNYLRFVARDLLTRFFEIADKRGLVLPDDSQELRSLLETFKSDRGEQLIGTGLDWDISTIALSVAALAQHYGLPTALLDWSRNPLIAAYFAAENADKAKRESLSLPRGYRSDVIVVWAYHHPEIGRQDSIARDPIRFVTAPTATNINLKAQQGVFTYVNQEMLPDSLKAPAPFEAIVEHFVGNADPAMRRSDLHHSHSRLIKFTLPASQADELLRLLWRLDVTPSSIYPGYGGVVRDIECESRWYRRDVLGEDGTSQV